LLEKRKRMVRPGGRESTLRWQPRGVKVVRWRVGKGKKKRQRRLTITNKLTKHAFHTNNVDTEEAEQGSTKCGVAAVL